MCYCYLFFLYLCYKTHKHCHVFSSVNWLLGNLRKERWPFIFNHLFAISKAFSDPYKSDLFPSHTISLQPKQLSLPVTKFPNFVYLEMFLFQPSFFQDILMTCRLADVFLFTKHILKMSVIIIILTSAFSDEKAHSFIFVPLYAMWFLF